jgi:hypothetical protein
LTKLENNLWIRGGRIGERGKRHLPGWRVGFCFLLAKPEFHSHLASWRVVISTLGLFRQEIACISSTFMKEKWEEEGVEGACEMLTCPYVITVFFV